jgi:type IV secretory pathway TraG/TraD family ATPase VirD4
MLSASEEQLQGTIASAEAALGWMNDPVLSAVACPESGQGLNLAAFLRRGAPSVYLIGSERPYGGLTPYFSLFANEFMEECRVQAERNGGRLRIPATVVADEAATTARIDLARWCAVSAGYNMTIVAGLQAMSQLSAWGDESVRETILSLFTTKVIAGGATSPAELDRLSKVCGEVDTWHREGRAKVRGKEQLYPPERLRLMAAMNALVLHRNSKAVQVQVTPVWKHRMYAPVSIRDAAPEITEE